MADFELLLDDASSNEALQKVLKDYVEANNGMLGNFTVDPSSIVYGRKSYIHCQSFNSCHYGNRFLFQLLKVTHCNIAATIICLLLKFNSGNLILPLLNYQILRQACSHAELVPLSPQFMIGVVFLIHMASFIHISLPLLTSCY